MNLRNVDKQKREKMKAVFVRLPAGLVERCREHKKRTGAKMTFIIRVALEEFLFRQEDRRMGEDET